MTSFPRRSGQIAQRPEMFETWAGRFPNADGGTAAAIKALVDGYKDFYSQHQRTAADETSTPGARLVKSAKAARTKLVPLIERLNVASETAAQRAAQLEATIAQAFNPPNKGYEACMRHQEIRAHFKALPQGDRIKLLEAARKAGDEDTLTAIASYQPYLSGLMPEMHQFARDHLIEAHAPKEAATLKSIQEQRQYAEQFRAQMMQTLGDLIDFAKADELIAAANDELAA